MVPTPAPVWAWVCGAGGQEAGRVPGLGVNAMEDDGRLRVLRVTEESPADEAGLKPGDVILGLGGGPGKGPEAFYRAPSGAGPPRASEAHPRAFAAPPPGPPVPRLFAEAETGRLVLFAPAPAAQPPLTRGRPAGK